ncbi:MAG: hypothetical protein H8E57_01105 [Candidatus Cloacimonetes bacterium]|nr:hypothetical protein [Candidatus Cloacimonadota bacterium]
MLVLNILFPPAVLWVILYFVFGENSIPAFRPLVFTMFLVGIIATLISYAIGIIAIIPNFILFTAALTLIFRLDLKQTLLSVGIFQVIMLILMMIRDSII